MSKAPTKAMMLTAGLGTRLRPVTDHLAKPAVPFLGTPLMYYAAYLLKEAGVTDITCNIHWKPGQVEKLADGLKKHGFSTHISPETCSPLGSGGGIWKARKYLDGSDFFVYNGDEVILPKKDGALSRLKAEHEKHGALATIAVMRHPLVGSQFGGVWARADGSVLGFGKDRSKFPEAKEGFHFIGLMMMSDRVFKYLPDGESNILYDALAAGIAKGEKVRAVCEEYTWFETGNPKDFLHATAEGLALLNTAKQEGDGAPADAKALLSILKTFNGSEFEITPLLLKHRDAAISNSAKLTGFNVLEKGAHVLAGAHIQNCVLLPGVIVNAGEERKDEIVLPSEAVTA